MVKKKDWKKIKKRRRFVFLVVFILLLFLGGYLLLRKKDYEISYHVKDYEIIENYHKEDNLYTFLIQKDGQQYFALQMNAHFMAKKIIYDITEYQTEDETCLVLSSNKVRFAPLCRVQNEQVAISLVSEEMQEMLPDSQNLESEEVSETSFGIEVSNYLHRSFYIWNYHGFYRLSKGVAEEISLFQKDIYAPNLIVQVGSLLFIPDYEADYYFEKAYILDMNTGKVENWQLSEPVYFDSVVLGVYDNKIYLVDRHEKKEWTFDLSRKKMEQIGSESRGGMTYQGEFITTSMNKLMYQDMTFTDVTPVTYTINNGLFYQYNDYRIRLSTEAPTSIVSYDEDWVFYLKNDSLYAYSLYYGEIFLMKYFEWNFNASNVVFIF